MLTLQLERLPDRDLLRGLGDQQRRKVVLVGDRAHRRLDALGLGLLEAGMRRKPAVGAVATQDVESVVRPVLPPVKRRHRVKAVGAARCRGPGRRGGIRRRRGAGHCGISRRRRPDRCGRLARSRRVRRLHRRRSGRGRGRLLVVAVAVSVVATAVADVPVLPPVAARLLGGRRAVAHRDDVVAARTFGLAACGVAVGGAAAVGAVVTGRGADHDEGCGRGHGEQAANAGGSRRCRKVHRKPLSG